MTSSTEVVTNNLKIFAQSNMAAKPRDLLINCEARYDILSMRNKKSSIYDIIGHMVWQPCFFWRLNLLKTLSRTAWQIERKLQPHIPEGLGTPGCSRLINRWHGVAAMLDWTKILKIYISLQSIDVKHHSYHLVDMWDICFKYQPDRMHGLAARII